MFRIPPFCYSYQSDLLIFSPSLHDSTIVYAINDNCVDACGPECVLIFQIVWNLLCGSGGCKGTWKTHQENILVFGKISKIVFLGWESMVQLNGRKLISHGRKRSMAEKWHWSCRHHCSGTRGNHARTQTRTQNRGKEHDN